MAKAKKSPSKTKAPPVTAVAKNAEEIQKMRNRVTNVIVDDSLEMAKRAVRSVKEGGNVTSLKYLWEVAGLFPAVRVGDDEDEDSLAKTLLERMGLSGDIPRHGEDEEGDVESE
jgi:hypothetical protein